MEDPPEVPPLVSHILEWFWKLSSRRQQSSSGPSPIAYTEIESWAKLTYTPISAWEVEVITHIDSVWLIEVGEEARKDRLRQEGMNKLKAQTAKKRF